jgi:predicted patatin/cPLA2 family phospholipase
MSLVELYNELERKHNIYWDMNNQVLKVVGLDKSFDIEDPNILKIINKEIRKQKIIKIIWIG